MPCDIYRIQQKVKDGKIQFTHTLLPPLILVQAELLACLSISEKKWPD
jgi:hypothetical protein